MTAALQSIRVGIVVERRKATSAWIDYLWRPVTALLGEPATAAWTQLSEDGDNATFYAGAADIALYRTETRNYRDNLAGDASLWVVLRPTGSEPPYTLFAVTADPAEGEAFTEVGDDLVDRVPMPDVLQDIVAAFVREHHVEQPQIKRRREGIDPQTLARNPKGAKKGEKGHS